MESDLLTGLQGGGKAGRLQSLSVAVNADSLSSWFLPGVATVLQGHGLLLDVVVDDQDHTHDALKSGDVTGCVTTLAQAMRGCVAEPLGVMRYRCMASPALVAQWSEPAAGGKAAGPNRLAHRLLASPAVIFNRKDALQDAFLAQHFKLKDALYPRHFVPAVDAFELALELGMGWGMVPDILLAARAHRPPLQEVLPGCAVDVRLYWQHWTREPLAAQRLTQAVKQAARERSCCRTRGRRCRPHGRLFLGGSCRSRLGGSGRSGGGAAAAFSSAVHFLMCEFLAAPESFLSAADFAQAALGAAAASRMHFFSKLALAAPASFFSADLAAQSASAPAAWAEADKPMDMAKVIATRVNSFFIDASQM